MRVFVLIIFISFSAKNFAQDIYTQNSDTLPKTKRDTVRLFFPLVEAGQDSVEKMNALDTFVNTWYSQMLSAMNEPILNIDDSIAEVYRFTWLRTFHKPISIRIQKLHDTISLAAKMLNGAGGYDPGKLILDTTINLTEQDWSNLQAKLTNIKFWKTQAKSDRRGFDGSEWILEGLSNNNYHFITRWTPGGSDYGRCCVYFLKLSGIKITSNEAY